MSCWGPRFTGFLCCDLEKGLVIVLHVFSQWRFYVLQEPESSELIEGDGVNVFISCLSRKVRTGPSGVCIYI